MPGEKYVGEEMNDKGSMEPWLRTWARESGWAQVITALALPLTYSASWANYYPLCASGCIVVKNVA